MFIVPLWGGAALAVEAPAKSSRKSSAEATDLPTIQVSGNSHRPARVQGELELDRPGTASIIDREQMDHQLVNNVRELVRYEPGVSAIGTTGRFGLDSFNVRGLSGNRTYMEIDGVPMINSFGADVAGGSFRSGRNFIDLETMKNVEIIRGPISALYRSDALAGSVILNTKDPADYLDSGKSIYTFLKEQYQSVDGSYNSTGTFAVGNEHNGFMLNLNYRFGHQTSNMGTVGGIGAERTKPDPLGYNVDGLLSKYVHIADSGRTDRITVNVFRQFTRTNGLSNLIPVAHTDFTPNFYYSQDSSTQLQASIGQNFPHLNSLFADTFTWRLYWRQASSYTNTQTDTNKVFRFYDNMPLAEWIAGGKWIGVKHFGGDGSVQQTMTYGAEGSGANDRSLVNGYGRDKITGATGMSPPFTPTPYPLHLIPESNTHRYAVFWEDKIDLLGGRLTLTPAVRAQRYEYLPEKDALYLRYNNGFVQRDFIDNNISPKFGLLWHFTDELSFYGNYAQGFRPPLYSELSGSWNEQPVPGLNIASLPNENLKSETSDNAEIGFRGQGEAGWFNVAAYYNTYHNFIWSGFALAPDQVPSWAYQIAQGAATNVFFQSVNAPHANIEGIEISGQLQLDAFSKALQGWSFRGAGAISRGYLMEPGNNFYSPLNTIDPAKMSLGLAYDKRTWGAQLIGTLVRRHPKLSVPAFIPDGYGLLDFFAHYQPIENVTLYFGVNNMTDRKYWDWGNLNGGVLGNLVAGNGLNDAGTGGLPADRLSMPGRNFSAAIHINF
ncbi:TonB-dependent hemoglobin/transferrin/lactoferrin family receptor [Candidatus Nitrosoglobus terrae]|uniref:TonB-dependent hemoglobin/transferrin/lactoferrin family receptor n=2 Tax=Candidatus Nitrosoglobus terrae TaxID=1630141 RepID=A0A1Q2SPQ9_9GAMM|nr:TonB-dependent hemoglobin/transferrin/lactoferrin family receptor [Candidatus Nitrosoglobus terrae]